MDNPAACTAPETVQGLLQFGAEAWPERTLIAFESGETWTRRQALQVAETAAAALYAQGVRPGDRVAVILPNGADWLRAWWGLALLGAILVPLNPAFHGRMLDDLLTLTEPSHLIAAGPADNAPHAVCLIDPAVLAGPAVPLPALPTVAPTDPHLIIFTSGTTGRSKGSLTANRHVVNQSFWMVESGAVDERDRFLGDLPLFHMAAIGNIAMMMRVGGSVALRARPSLSDYWTVAASCGATFAVLVSSMSGRLLQNPPGPEDRAHGLRFFLTSPLPADPDRFIARFGLEGLCSGFGSTETSTAICKRIDQENRAGTCGTAREGYELRVVGPDMVDLPAMARGELLIRPRRSGTMSLGYFNDPDATAQAWHDGWFRTGDIVERDQDGFFFWRDRLKESIRRRGENISSYEVEREINLFPGVIESACVGVTGGFAGDEEIKAFVVGATQVDFPGLVRHLAQRLPHFMVPRFFERIDALPRTATLRIQKVELKARARGAQEWDREAAGVVVERKRDGVAG